MSKEDGGPAFPAVDRTDPAPQLGEAWFTVTPQNGMSLRDYFAAKAIVMAWNWALEGDLSDIHGLRLEAAKQAYAFADAMLEARK